MISLSWDSSKLKRSSWEFWVPSNSILSFLLYTFFYDFLQQYYHESWQADVPVNRNQKSTYLFFYTFWTCSCYKGFGKMFYSQNICPWPIDESNLWHLLNQFQEALMNHDDPCTDTHRHCTIMFLAFFHIFCHIFSFERWCFCVFGGIWGHLRHVAKSWQMHAEVTPARRSQEKGSPKGIGDMWCIRCLYILCVCTIHVLYIIWTIVKAHWELYISI